MSTNDINAARRTYSSFIGHLKWIVPVLAVIAMIVVLVIAE